MTPSGPSTARNRTRSLSTSEGMSISLDDILSISFIQVRCKLAASVDRRLRASAYSSLIPASLMIFWYLACSLFTNAAKVARDSSETVQLAVDHANVEHQLPSTQCYSTLIPRSRATASRSRLRAPRSGGSRTPAAPRRPRRPAGAATTAGRFHRRSSAGRSACRRPVPNATLMGDLTGARKAKASTEASWMGFMMFSGMMLRRGRAGGNQICGDSGFSRIYTGLTGG